MEPYELRRDPDGTPVVSVPYRGLALLGHPMFNKGSAFTHEERRALDLEGKLPHGVSSMELQLRRVHGNVQRASDDLERYVELAELQDRNEHLFYRLLLEHLEEYMPVVYTPTVGRACQEYSHIFRRGRGLWITPEHRGRIHEVLEHAPYEDVRLIVVTDNERILGLGDQGAGGMGIPIGKLSLYCVAAGIHPARTLPVSLDVGTDNPALLADELYLGWRAPRLRGEEYDALVDEFVQAVKRRFPRALLQWEDFKKGNAFALLDRYREALLSFNDDIEGTAAVALAGVMASGRVTGRALHEEQVVILGAGAAGIGIARQLRDAFAAAGRAGDDLTRAIAVIDSRGLLVDDADRREAYKQEFAWPARLAAAAGLGERRDLRAVVEALKPTVLIGTSGQPCAFDEATVRAMAAGVERPVICPFSNPTSKAEATPNDLLRWTEGRALVATGSPFPPVTVGERTVRIGQGNNAYIFPAVGLGALAAGARRITDSMFTVAARALAAEVSDEDLDVGLLYPPVGELRDLTGRIAEAVAREVLRRGLGEAMDEAEVPARVAALRWVPRYPRYEPV